ncbi:MAG: GntR family transcriptional regulator [Micrococcaceae bacterium]
MAVLAGNAASFQKKQLSNHIAEHIRAEILAGNYPPGKFLRLDEVAKELGVSVTPVREAFMALSVEGFVRHAERRGFLVTPLNYTDFEDLYTLLAQVAGRLAERAASAMSTEDIAELEAIHARMQEAAEHSDPAEVEHTNDEFHRVINRAANSSKLAWILLSILKYVPKRFYASIHGLTPMLLEQHERILTAIRDRNPAEAYAAMYEHEKVSMRSVLEHLDQQALFSKQVDQ